MEFKLQKSPSPIGILQYCSKSNWNPTVVSSVVLTVSRDDVQETPISSSYLQENLVFEIYRVASNK